MPHRIVCKRNPLIVSKLFWLMRFYSPIHSKWTKKMFVVENNFQHFLQIRFVWFKIYWSRLKTGKKSKEKETFLENRKQKWNVKQQLKSNSLIQECVLIYIAFIGCVSKNHYLYHYLLRLKLVLIFIFMAHWTSKIALLYCVR